MGSVVVSRSVEIGIRKTVKGKAVPAQADDCSRLRLSGFSNNLHVKVAPLSTLRSAHLIPREDS